jgi:hypothetical protein
MLFSSPGFSSPDPSPENVRKTENDECQITSFIDLILQDGVVLNDEE